MSNSFIPHSPDLCQLTDDELVALAVGSEHSPAGRALLLRYWLFSQRLVIRLARRTSLPNHLVPDAQQEAWFALTRALTVYDPRAGCSFPTFLYRVVSGRFYDFARSERRRQRHYDRSLGAGEALEGGRSATGARLAPWDAMGPGSDDAAGAVEPGEWDARLEKFRAGLDESERTLLAVVMSRRSLKAKATQAVLGCAQATAFRRRKALLAKFRAYLEESGD